MDGETIVWLLFIVIWFVSSIVQQIRKMGKNMPGQVQMPPVDSDGNPIGQRPPPPPPPRERPRPDRSAEQIPDPLRDLMRQLGVEVVEQPVERPVASEHRQAPSELRQAAGEIRQDPGETLITYTEHQRTASEARRTASEHRQDAYETDFTASEHRRGDAVVLPRQYSLPATVGRGRRSRVGGAVRRELRRGGGLNLKKALVLKEILDRPPGLRPPGTSPGG